MGKDTTKAGRSDGATSSSKDGGGKVKVVTFSGCVICRIRRKKCDERKPSCETCERLNIECLGYSNKRPLYLQDKANLDLVRAEITAFLQRSGRVRRHGKGDALSSSKSKAKGKGKAKQEESYEEEEEEEEAAVEPEILRFSFSLDTRADVGAAMGNGTKRTAPTAKKEAVKKAVKALPPLQPVSASPSPPREDSPDAEGSDVDVDYVEEFQYDQAVFSSPPSPFLRTLPKSRDHSPFAQQHHQPIYSPPQPNYAFLQPSPPAPTYYHHPFYLPPQPALAFSHSNINTDAYFPPAEPLDHFPLPSPPLRKQSLAGVSFSPAQTHIYFPPPEPGPGLSTSEHSWSQHSAAERYSPTLLESPDPVNSVQLLLNDDEERPAGEVAQRQRESSGSAPMSGYEMVPKGLNSPLERMGLPVVEFAYIQYCVGLMDSIKALAGRPGSITQQTHLNPSGVHEPLIDPIAISARLNEVKTAQAVIWVAVRQPSWRDVMCCFAARHQALRRAAGEPGRSSRPREWTPPVVELESQVYRIRAFESLMTALADNTIDVVSALFTAQRMIWSEVIRGGTSAWYQPLLIARRCVERIVGERAMKGQLGEGRLGDVLMYLLKFTLWVDVLGCITLSEETPLYDLYTAVLSSPDSGIDMNCAVGFSNLGTLLLLQTSRLASLKRSSPLPLSPSTLAALALPLQTLINSLWSPSHLPSSDPNSTKLLIYHIYLHGAQLYLTSVTEPDGNDPENSVVKLSVELMMECVRRLPDPQLRRSATMPIVMAGCLVRREGAGREVFRGWMESLGSEAIWVGNSRPSLWLMEQVWERRDTLDALEPGRGAEVDLFAVMKEMGWELLMA